jgi:DNA-binding CsgD family transcriptional regulator
MLFPVKPYKRPPRGFPSRLRVGKVARLARQGHTFKEIGRRLGCSESTVSQYCLIQRIPTDRFMHDRVTSPEVRAEIAAMRAEGRTVREIAGRYDLAPSTVYRLTCPQPIDRRTRPYRRSGMPRIVEVRGFLIVD